MEGYEADMELIKEKVKRGSLQRCHAIEQSYFHAESLDENEPSRFSPQDNREARLCALGRSSSFSYFQRGRMASPVSCLKGSSNNSSNNSLRSENRPPKRVSWVDEIDVVTFNDSISCHGSPFAGTKQSQHTRQKLWDQSSRAQQRSASFELGYAGKVSGPSRISTPYNREFLPLEIDRSFLQRELKGKPRLARGNKIDGSLKMYNQSLRLERGWALVRTKFRQIITALRDDIDF